MIDAPIWIWRVGWLHGTQLLHDVLNPAWAKYTKTYPFEGVTIKQAHLNFRFAFCRCAPPPSSAPTHAYARPNTNHARILGLRRACVVLRDVQFRDLAEVDMSDAFEPLAHVKPRFATRHGPTARKKKKAGNANGGEEGARGRVGAKKKNKGSKRSYSGATGPRQGASGGAPRSPHTGKSPKRPRRACRGNVD